MHAILGATGAVGRSLAPLLAATGEPFRVVGRSAERLHQAFGSLPHIEFCEADFSHTHGAERAVAGVDTLYYLAGVPYTHFELHPKMTRVVLDAAAGAGVRQFVLQGTVYPFGEPQRERVDESHPRNPHTFKGRMRKEQEDVVLAADGRNGMRVLILRAPDFYGPHSELSYVRAIFDAAIKGGTANVIGPIDTPHEFIYVPDLARTLLALSHKDDAYGRGWNVGGPGVITTRRFAELVFAEVGQTPRLRVASKRMLTVMGWFSPFMREIREMHYLWTTPVIIDDSHLRALLPDLRKTSYEEGIKETVRTMREGS